jgi:hypothetical protein
MVASAQVGGTQQDPAAQYLHITILAARAAADWTLAGWRLSTAADQVSRWARA